MTENYHKVTLYIPKTESQPQPQQQKQKRTPSRAAALRLIAHWRQRSCFSVAARVYCELVKPFPRVSPEVTALRKIADLTGAAAGRDWTPLMDRINEIARGWK